ncbi:FAD-linked oxidase C-terminal domain-containing protein [Methylomarinum sp. Ch1-1]|uniref:FAD-linked oxidase C-terminal domain-containing protein n=1 Tax=Methylomarinum roseum TaxID=3067653 RepID=A0AAU7NTH3_9GAMM|nr:FAD-linked oxidase C-terminal domain-containing protein [Methylomarinum sp. Ch1-1]MDP4519716.1 FAD-linked oxidase C-terminal domain-containing protein [Methylomarinum sp. Ch1-1]
MVTIQPHSSERVRHQVSKNDLLAALRHFLPDSAILAQEEQVRAYECDGLSAYRCLPWLVVLPETIEQVQHVLRLCHRLGVPVVARGAGTGLAGGAIPLDNGVLLSLSRFNRILDIDVNNRQARVQPGVRNLAISHAVAPYGLYYAPDPSSQIACSIGGNVAENSGGVHCLKYGLTTHNIQQLQVITMDGEWVTIGGQGLDGPGYDLLALMTGSEGMLGVIVEITVKLLPIPEQAQVILAAFDDVEKAGNAVAAIIAAGLIPAGLEMMDNAAIKAAEDFVHAGYPCDAEAILLCEMDGSAEQVTSDLEQALRVLRRQGASEVRVAESEQQRQQMWAGRKAAFPAVGRISADYYCMDGTIPRRHLAKVLMKIKTFSAHYGLAVANVFHAGDGNLHPLILYDADREGEMQKAEQLGGDILRLSVEVGGTISGEHGVGVEKINHMCFQFQPHELALFHALKRAFDDKGLLNPGKAVPTLHRCAEFGAMHVHDGELPHPEIERF